MEKDFEDLIDIKQLSNVVNMTAQAIYHRIKAGTFPTGVKIGSARLWKSAEIDAWLKSREKAEV